MGERDMDEILFGKYIVKKQLGMGRQGTVWQVYNQNLQMMQCMKRVERNQEQDVMQEVRCLGQLKHRGIPAVFSVEEDAEYVYIFMEWLTGVTLEEESQTRGPFSLDLVIHYGVQLCEIVEYLHGQTPEPLLHLDLQPANLLVAGHNLHIIDFGCAVFQSQAVWQKIRYGTPGFCAPEVFRRYGNVGVQADVYSIGKILWFMWNGQVPFSGDIRCLWAGMAEAERKKKLWRIIQQCISPNQTDRHHSVKALRRELERLKVQMPEEKEVKQEENPPFTIAVAGTQKGIGTTHVALSLAAYLSDKKVNALYCEEQMSRHLYHMKKFDGQVKEREGIYYKGSCPMLPHNERRLHPDAGQFSVQVKDYGAYSFQFAEALDAAHVVLLISGMKGWELDVLHQILERMPERSLVLFNHGDTAMFHWAKKEVHRFPAFRLPYAADPFRRTREMDRFLEKLVDNHLRPTQKQRGERWESFIKRY